MTDGRGTRLARFASRIGWGLADQALSSLTNFVLGVVVARTVGLTDFGAFSLAFAAYLIVAGLSRAVTAQPLLIRYGDVSNSDWRRGASAATGMALLIGATAAIVALSIALVADGSVRSAFLALALVLPGLVVQDAWRFAFFAGSRGRAAFVNDSVWAIAQLSMLFLAITLGAGTVFWAVIAWGGAATMAALVGMAQARLVPQPLAVRRWWREHRDLLPPYVGEVAANILAGQLLLYAVGLVAGLPAVGAMRGAHILLGPLYVVAQGVYLVAVPEAVRILRTSDRRFNQFCVATGLALGAVGVAWTVTLVLIPRDFGTALMGDVWDPARSVVPIWGLAFAAINLGTGAAIGLRALAAAPRTLRAAALVSVLSFASGVSGAQLAGLAGAGLGYLLAQLLGIVLWWWEFRGGRRDHIRVDLAGATSTPLLETGTPGRR